jgi:hypothetical protein
MLPPQPQNPILVDWYPLPKAQVGPDATIAPKWVFGLKPLKARERLLITLSHARRPAACHRSNFENDLAMGSFSASENLYRRNLSPRTLDFHPAQIKKPRGRSSPWGHLCASALACCVRLSTLCSATLGSPGTPAVNLDVFCRKTMSLTSAL